MDKHLKHQQTRFSAAAARYDQLARVQQAVADRLFQGLAFLGNPRRVLDIGCGTGALTRKLAATWPRAEVEGIDSAPGMIDEAQRLHRTEDRPRFTCADARTFAPGHRYDLLVSTSTLHWIQPLDRTFAHLATLLEPGGNFAFALMLEHTLGELHALRREIAPGKPPAARMPSESAVRAALAGAGLRVAMDEVEERVTHAESALAVLHDLRALGVTGGSLSRGATPLTRGELTHLIVAYDARHREADGVRATYHVGYFWGSRGA
ncbi:MAG TPA: methyltransferase domain-containing protein [Kiritimatiellia bacterium]|nr:methyltransferase domain-containing protein [Kiritimatiellia bacterium]